MESSIISLTAYSIQALQTRTFAKLIILLGNFHLKLAFFGAVGNFLALNSLSLKQMSWLRGALAGFMKGNSITDLPKSIKYLLLLWKESLSLSTSN